MLECIYKVNIMQIKYAQVMYAYIRIKNAHTKLTNMLQIKIMGIFLCIHYMYICEKEKERGRERERKNKILGLSLE